MALKHYTLLLNGSAQRVSAVLPSGANNAQPTVAEDLAFRYIRLQQVPANTNVIYVGADSTVSSTNHGGSMDPTQASAVDSIDIGPFDTGPLRLSDVWVIGTNAERLAILGVPF